MRRAAVLLTALGLGLPACGGEDDEAAVRGVAAAYGEAVAKKDYQRICDELIAPSLGANLEQVGLPCELAFKQGLQGVQGPKLTVGEVKADGKKASVQVTTTARGQRPSKDALQLVKTGDEWRISALGR